MHLLIYTYIFFSQKIIYIYTPDGVPCKVGPQWHSFILAGVKDFNKYFIVIHIARI